MSWLAKVSNIAGRAEDLLNQIDQNAAAALRNTQRRDDSSVILVDTNEANTLQKPQSEITKTTTSCHIRTDQTYLVSSKIRQKKSDELIGYLNNSNEPTSSRCSSVASCFSNPHIANASQTPPEPYTAEDLKTLYLDTMKCLNMKESQIAVMSVRLQEAEEVIIKKDARIAEMDKKLKSIRKELEARNGDVANNQSTTLKKLQHEHNREREEFEKREQSYMKRLESANNANSENKKELQELKAKILKMEINERDLTEEVRLAKYNLEANKHEFDEYKKRSQKILFAKENLLTSLKKNSLAETDDVVNSVEVKELRCELDLLKDDLQHSQLVIYNLKGDLQEMENRLRDEQRASGAQREDLLKQIHHHLTQANYYKEQVERTQLECNFLRTEMHRQEEAVEKKLVEKDIEIAKLLEGKNMSKQHEMSEMEQKISLLSEKLIMKQTAFERIESEKRALEFRLKRAEFACKNAEASAIKAVTVEMHGTGVSANHQSCSLLTVSYSDNMLVRTAKLAVQIFDRFGLRLAIFMHNPIFRFFFFIHCLLLHVWVFFVLFTYTPEIHPF